jgi:hypothetical protein
MPMNHRLLRPRASRSVAGFDPAAAAYITAVEAADGQALETGVRDAINTFITGCKSDGIWSAIKASCILMGARTLAGALTPLAGAAPTNNNFVSGDYSRRAGLKGNGSNKTLNSNRANNADDKDNCHAYAYVSGAPGNLTINGVFGAGWYAGNDRFLAWVDQANNLVYTSANNAAQNITQATRSIGGWGVARSGASSWEWMHGTTPYARSEASVTPASGNVLFFTAGNVGASAKRMAFYSLGANLSLATLHARVSTFYNAIGVVIVPQVSNADAQDWLNRVYDNGGTVSATTASAVNTFCNAIDAAGIRDRFYRLNLFCGNSDASLIAVRTPLYRSQVPGGTQFGNTLDTNVNFAITDYAETGASGGLLGDGTSKYLSTGLTPAAMPEIATGHLSAYIPSLAPGSTRALMGAASGSQQFQLTHRLTGGNQVQVRATWGGTSSSDDTFGAGVTTLPGGLWTITRTSSTAITKYNNATSKATGTTSTTPATHTNGWFVHASNSAGTAASFANHRILSYSIGASMTAQQVSDYNAAIQAFQTALSRNV